MGGDTDEVADPVDVVHLWNALTRAKGKTLRYYHMGHATFMIGRNMLYLQDVINILRS